MLDSRLAFDGGPRSRIYLATSGSRLCLYEVNDEDGYVASTCKQADDLLNPRELLMLIVFRPGASTRVAALALDGTRQARRVEIDGSVKPLTVRNNVIVDDLERPARISWTSADGSLIDSPLMAPPFP